MMLRVKIAFAVACAVTAGYAGNTCCTLTADNVEVVASRRVYGTTQLAIDEMTNALSQAFGRAIPRVSRPTPGKLSIVLGTNEWSEAVGIDVRGLPRDGFVLRTVGRERIFIAGKDSPIWNAAASVYRGEWPSGESATLFGVYEFLERFADVRFYFPGEFGTLIPRRRRIDVPFLNERCAPEYLVRDYYAGGRADVKMYEGAPCSAAAFNWLRTRMETEKIPCCHGSTRFRYSERFAATHPEYFTLMNGKRLIGREMEKGSTHYGHLCWSSAVVDELEKDVLSYFRGEDASVRGIPGRKPGTYAWGSNCMGGRYVDIMPNDSFFKCQCERCKAVWKDSDEDYASELIWGVTARIGRKLLDEGLPGYITQMAYCPYARVPDVTLPTNVLVMTAVMGPYALINAEANAKQERKARAWVEKTGTKTWLWTYPRKDEEMKDAPSMCPRAWGRYFKGIAPYTIGAFAEAETDRWMFHHLNYYVFGKVCWNSKVDVAALLDEYYRRMFGAAAPDMRRIYEEMEEIWLKRVAGRFEETPLGPVLRRPNLHVLWTTVYPPAMVGRWMKAADAAAAKLNAGSGERGRVEFMRRELIKPVCDAAVRYARESSPEEELKRRAAHPEETSIVQCGDFSAKVHGRNCGGRHGWFKDAAPFPVDTNVFFSAGASLRLDGTGGKSVSVIQMLPELKPSTRYRLSFFIKLENMRGGIGAYAVVNDSVNNTFPKRRQLNGTIDWTHFSFELKTRPAFGKESPFVRFVVPRNSLGTAWFDCVRLSEIPEQ